MRLKICDSHLTCKVANKCLNVRERVEVVEWEKMVPSLPLLSCELSVSVKENPDKKKIKIYIYILPALILKKPSKRSKAKDHKQCVTRRMQLWKEGNICEIMREVRYIQRKITTLKKKRTAGDISKTFAKLMMQGKVSVALKYLDNESSSVMTCTDSVLKELREKHPPEAPIK